MKKDWDVIVIGGGPIGSFAAYNLARRNAEVAVFEEHDEIGVPVHCAGHLSIQGLRNLSLYPLTSGIVENLFSGAVFHSPRGKQFSVHLSSSVTCTINRTAFDKHVASIAEAAGAHYFLKSPVDSLIIQNDSVQGVIVRSNEKQEKVLAKVVIDAEGISSRIIRGAGLTPLNRHMLVNAVQAEVENVKCLDPSTVEVFLGEDYAPGFYGWLIPKLGGRAKVGVASKSGNPKEFLQRLMTSHPSASPKLGSARVLQMAFHPITLGGPIPVLCKDGFVAVGDAASQVKPTTGGGLIFGLSCAQFAAEVVSRALRENNVTSSFLGAYQKRCEEALGFDMRAMIRMRKRLNAMSDRKLERLVEMCTKLGLSKSLERVKDMDFQGRSFLSILHSPRMLAILGYYFFLYLSANP